MEHSTYSKYPIINFRTEKDIKRLSSRNTGHDMEIALQYVSNGISIREAAKKTNLAYATVRRYWLKSKYGNELNRKTKANVNATNSNYTFVFNDRQELLLKKYFATISDLQCRKLAYRIAMLNKITVDPKWHDNQLATEKWLNDFKLRHSMDCDKTNLTNNLTPSSYNKQLSQSNENLLPGNSNVIHIKELNTRKSLPLINNSSIENADNLQIKCEIDAGEYDEEFNDSDFESTSDEGGEDDLLDEQINNHNHNNKFTMNANDNFKLDNKKIIQTNIDKNIEIESNINQDNSIELDKSLKIDSLFKSELINTLKMIANSTSMQKDPDELFLLSLLPSLKKIKESDKLKARIELINALEKFN